MQSEKTPLALLRISQGKSQEELGNLVGKSRSWISLLERGLLSPDEKMQRLIADTLKVNVDRLQAAQGWSR